MPLPSQPSLGINGKSHWFWTVLVPSASLLLIDHYIQITFRRVRPISSSSALAWYFGVQMARVFSFTTGLDVFTMQAKSFLTPFLQSTLYMHLLSGAFAGVRRRLSGTGAGDGERSRRYTVTSALTPASSSSSLLESGLGPAETPGTENFETGHVGLSTIQAATRKLHKSVTFSSVDFITHIPAATYSSASISSSSSKSQKLSVQNYTPSCPTSPDRLFVPNYLSGWRRRRRHTLPGSHQGTDSSRSSYFPIDGENIYDCHLILPYPQLSQPQTGKKSLSTLISRSNYYHEKRSDLHSPSGYVPLQHQYSPSPGQSLYDDPPRSRTGTFLFQSPCGIAPLIGNSTILHGQLSSSSSGDTLPYEIYYNSNSHHDHPGYRKTSTLAQHSIHLADLPRPPITTPKKRHFSGGLYSFESPHSYSYDNGIEYIILPLGSRFALHSKYSSHPECLALLDTRTASLIPSDFPPPKSSVEGTGAFLVSYASNEKGHGMFAQKPLRTGEVILAEVPTLVIPSNMPNYVQNSGFTLDASIIRADVYEKMFAKLSRGVRKELIDLAWGASYTGHVNVYETIMRINPLAVSLPLSPTPGCSFVTGSNFSSIHRGIFLKTGRCNHRYVHDTTAKGILISNNQLRPKRPMDI